VAVKRARDKAAEPESGHFDRLVFFSDAVVAIAITLLALDLPVPKGQTVSELWASIQDDYGHYLAFLITFVVIAAMWSRHHQVFRYVERSDARLRTLNLLWLLAIVLLPFATKVLTFDANDDTVAHAIRFGFYALLEVFATAVFLAMVRHFTTRGLATADVPPSLLHDAYSGGGAVIVIFGLSIPLLFATQYAWLLWIFGPPLVDFVRRLRSPRESRTA
jgi:uncharacterized membrane protein